MKNGNPTQSFPHDNRVRTSVSDLSQEEFAYFGEVLKILGEEGISCETLEKEGDDGESPLSLALLKTAKKGHSYVLKYLLKEWNSFDNSNKPKRLKACEAALRVAVEEGHIEAVEILLEEIERSADSEDALRVALFKAAEIGRLDVMKWLLQQWVPKHPISWKYFQHYRNNVWSLAAANGHIDIMKWLLAQNWNIGVRILAELFFFGTLGQWKSVGKWLGDQWYAPWSPLSPWMGSYGPKERSQVTDPLVVAVENGQTDVVDWFVDMSARKYPLDQCDYLSAVKKAIQHGHSRILERLLTKENVFLEARSNRREYIDYGYFLKLAIDCGQFKMLKWMFDEKNRDLFQQRGLSCKFDTLQVLYLATNAWFKATDPSEINEWVEFFLKKEYPDFSLEKEETRKIYLTELYFHLAKFNDEYDRKSAMLEWLLNLPWTPFTPKWRSDDYALNRSGCLIIERRKKIFEDIIFNAELMFAQSSQKVERRKFKLNSIELDPLLPQKLILKADLKSSYCLMRYLLLEMKIIEKRDNDGNMFVELEDLEALKSKCTDKVLFCIVVSEYLLSESPSLSLPPDSSLEYEPSDYDQVILKYLKEAYQGHSSAVRKFLILKLLLEGVESKKFIPTQGGICEIEKWVARMPTMDIDDQSTTSPDDSLEKTPAERQKEDEEKVARLAANLELIGEIERAFETSKFNDVEKKFHEKFIEDCKRKKEYYRKEHDCVEKKIRMNTKMEMEMNRSFLFYLKKEKQKGGESVPMDNQKFTNTANARTLMIAHIHRIC